MEKVSVHSWRLWDFPQLKVFLQVSCITFTWSVSAKSSVGVDICLKVGCICSIVHDQCDPDSPAPRELLNLDTLSAANEAPGYIFESGNMCYFFPRGYLCYFYAEDSKPIILRFRPMRSIHAILACRVILRTRQHASVTTVIFGGSTTEGTRETTLVEPSMRFA